MSEILFSTLALVMMAVITQEQILDDIPIGMPEEEAVAYFRELTDDDRIRYFTKESQRMGTVSHDLQDDEHGYYVIGISNVRSRWWWPSFGAVLRVILVISDDGLVSEIKFFGGRVGWP